MDYNDVQSVKEIYWKNKWESLWELHGENFKLLRFYVARSGLWKQAAKHYRKLFYEEFNSGHYMKRLWSKTNADADRRLELLKTCNATMPACPFCGENLKVWDRLAYNERKVIGHKPDCELAKELKDEQATT